MKIHRAYKTELKLNNKQRTACLQHAGASRFAYNWGLQRKQEVFMMNTLPVPHIVDPSAIDLHKELVILKKTDYPWMYEVSKCAPQEALRNLDKAYKNFFKGNAKFPKFKSKKNSINSFHLMGVINVFDNTIQLPRLGKLRLKEKEYIPTDEHILSATVSEKAGRWFVSVLVEEDIEVPENSSSIVGVDLGIKTMAYISDGTKFENPKALKKFERKLAREQRRLSKKKKGSMNRKKQKLIVAKVHRRIANIRKDAIHKATTWLAKNKSVICIEDLNVSGMLKNRHLSKSLSDVGMGMFRSHLLYKTDWYGSRVTIADRFFPSTKRCSQCGHINTALPLSQRTFVCENCRFTLDRDLNASLNLEQLAVSSTESEKTPVGEGSSDFPKVKLPSMNQELNTGLINSPYKFQRNGDSRS